MADATKQNATTKPTGSEHKTERFSGGLPKTGPSCEAEANSLDGVPEPDATATPSGARSPGRFWLAILFGAAVTLPFAWLLSYAAALPFFLGLFFFALFGLVIGAFVYRLAVAHGPHSRNAVLIGTALLVGWGWGLSIAKEGFDFPVDRAKGLSATTRSIGDRSLAEYEAFMANGIRDYLSQNYAPGGVMGYLRWVVTNGEIQRGEIPELRKPVRVSQSGWVWIVRVLLSILLYAFGISTQTLGVAAARSTASQEAV